MKKIFVLILMMMFSAPVFCAPGYEKAMEKIGGEPRVYDVSKEQKYFEELERKFFEKYADGKNGGITGEKYDAEVRIPAMDYMFKVQKERGTGFSEF